MEQKLVSLHLQTFRTAAKINPRLRKKIKLVGPYLSYQPWQDLRAMITKFLLLLGAPIRAIRPQNRSGRAFYRQGEFSF
jgi:hypothetical protein